MGLSVYLKRCLASMLWAMALFGLFNSARANTDTDWFVEVSQSLGVKFVHQNGAIGKYDFIETAASGGGWLDYDDDGDPDLYLINAQAEGTTMASNVLYENRDGKFVDVSAQAGVGDTGYGMGMCVGDYDADGHLDFLLTNAGTDRLFRNLGDGRFKDVAKLAGVDFDGWSTNCAFADLDADGDLDLYVSHYVKFDRDDAPICTAGSTGQAGYCSPIAFTGVTDSLYINQGDGRFVDKSRLHGIDQGNNDRGYGVIISDLNGDNRPDIYVANDGSVNRVYINQGQAKFKDNSLFSGAGLNLNGQVEAGMGVDLGDVNGDGQSELYISHFAIETNTLYRGLGGGLFEDTTNRYGLAVPSFGMVGWGVKFFDYDNDADLDLAVANGHIQENINSIEPRLSYAQRNQLFENDAGQRFSPIGAKAGIAWQREAVSRGLAAADFNSDGRLDLLVTNTNAQADLLLNQYPSENHWLGIHLFGPPENRFAIGAKITLTSNGQSQIREVSSGGSFLSQSDLRQHFGLGPKPNAVTVQVRWPDGHVQRLSTDSFDRYWSIQYQK